MTYLVISTEVLLLARTYTHYASRYLKSYGTQSQQTMFLLGLAGIVAFWVILVNWEKIISVFQSEPQQQDELLAELTSAHRLSRSDAAWISKVTEELKLEHAAMLFIQPELWKAYIENHAAEASRGQKLFKQLFGTDLEKFIVANKP